LKRWLKEAAFAKAYKAARSEWFDSVLQDLERVAKKSIVTLDQAMKAKKPADRIRAALGLLSHAFKAKEQFELEERLEALEERLRSEGAK
jgi:hypothetical protein